MIVVAASLQQLISHRNVGKACSGCMVQELEAIISRAALQSPEASEQLPEEVFWFAMQPKDRLKWNLLSPGAFPWLKPFLRRYSFLFTLVQVGVLQD